MKKIYLLCAGLLAGSVSFAQFNVTFQVDMNSETVSANGVHVAGSFQAAAGASSDWQPGETTLTDPNTDGIYDVTVSIPAGRYEYKFINDNNWGAGEEAIPAVCQVEEGTGNSNRYVFISSDTTLPAIVFAGSAPAGMTFVKVKADMRNQLTMTSTPDVMGAFNNWSDHVSLYDPEMDSIYYNFVYYDAAEDTMQYKFRNTHDWGDSESVNDLACSVPGGNRYIETSADAISDANCYGQCGPCVAAAPADTIKVTLRVDMNYEAVCSAPDSVDVTGAGAAFGSWGTDPIIMTDANSDGVYEVTLDLLSNTSYEYKFRSNVGGNAKWESSANRTFMTAINADTTLDVVCFEQMTSCSASGPAPFGPADVTFAVDMASEVPGDTIWVMGSFTNPQWQAGALPLEFTGEGAIFATTVEICPNNFNYKFINGDVNTVTNEEFNGDTTGLPCNVENGIGGYNRSFSRTDTGNIVIAYSFGTCDEFEFFPLGVNEVAGSLNASVFPNPFQNTFNVVSDNSIASVTVLDLSGRVVTQMNDLNANTVTISDQNLTSGIYIVRVESVDGTSKTMKVSAL